MTARRNFSPWGYWRLRLDTVEHVDPLPEDGGEIVAWRGRVRDRLDVLLAPWPEPVPLDVEVRAEHGHDGYRRHEIVFDSERFMSVPANLLVPDGRDAPGPAVLAVHGHGLDKDSVCGVTPATGAPPGSDFARQLVRRGSVVLAPDLRGFGERADAMLPRLDTSDFAADYGCNGVQYSTTGAPLPRAGYRTRPRRRATSSTRASSTTTRSAPATPLPASGRHHTVAAGWGDAAGSVASNRSDAVSPHTTAPATPAAASRRSVCTPRSSAPSAA